MGEMFERVCGVSVGEVLPSGEGREETSGGTGDIEELEGFIRVDMDGDEVTWRSGDGAVEMGECTSISSVLVYFRGEGGGLQTTQILTNLRVCDQPKSILQPFWGLVSSEKIWIHYLL